MMSGTGGVLPVKESEGEGGPACRRVHVLLLWAERSQASGSGPLSSQRESHFLKTSASLPVLVHQPLTRSTDFLGSVGLQHAPPHPNTHLIISSEKILIF